MVERIPEYSGIVLGVLMILSFAIGCEEKEVTVISDRDEVMRYIEESLDGRELFRTTGLINTDTFTLPADPAVYYDSVESINRTKVFLAAPSDAVKRYKEPNLTVRDAEVAVTDRISVRRYRIVGIDTTSAVATREFVRYGHFLKLGDDFKPFAGWKLFGFNGGIPGFPLSMTVTGPGNNSIVVNSGLYTLFEFARIDTLTGEFTGFGFRSVEAYLRLDQIANFDGGGDIDVSVNSVTSQSSYLLLGGQALSGSVTLRANRPVSDEYEMSFQSQFSPPYLWNLLVCQEYRGSSPSYVNWFVPYRVP